MVNFCIDNAWLHNSRGIKMNIKKGDPVRVRLASGEIVEVVYDSRFGCKPSKMHYVTIGEQYMIAGSSRPSGTSFCRCIGPTATMDPL